MKRKSSNLSFPRVTAKIPSISFKILNLLQVPQWNGKNLRQENLLLGNDPETAWEWTLADGWDHTVELSVFWHVIRFTLLRSLLLSCLLYNIDCRLKILRNPHLKLWELKQCSTTFPRRYLVVYEFFPFFFTSHILFRIPSHALIMMSKYTKSTGFDIELVNTSI